MVVKAETGACMVLEWMERHKLCIAAEKTEAVLLAKRRGLKDVKIRVGNNLIAPKKHVKYLGVILGEDMKMAEHIRRAAIKAGKCSNALARIMPNWSSTTEAKRKLLGAVTYSVLLYAAPTWSGLVKKKKYAAMIQGVQRKVLLRICSAYRTCSTVALQVIASAIPIDLVVEERVAMYQGQQKVEARKKSMVRWQQRWDNNVETGQWTKTIIPKVEAWTERKFGGVSFYTTQFLSGHGCFAAFLNKIKKIDSDQCWFCDDGADTCFHTFFVCRRWENARRELESKIGAKVCESNVIKLMTGDEDRWKKITTWIEEVIREKEKEERKRQTGPQQTQR